MGYGHLIAPAPGAFSITPNDTGNIHASSLYVGVGGDLHVLTEAEDDVIFSGVGGGTVLPIRVKRIFATSTTASAIIGLRED
jgi:hypothetical protein